MNDAGEQVTREILGNVPGWLVGMFYLGVLVGCAAAGAVFVLRFARRRRGRISPPERASAAAFVRGSWQALVRGAFHRKMFDDRWAGIAHLLTFYGFVILFIGTCLVALEHQTPLHFFYGWFYRIASCVIDLGGLAFLIGLGLFLWYRHVTRVPRLMSDPWTTAFTWLLVAIGISGFLLEASRIAVEFPRFEIWSVVGYPLACGLAGLGISGSTAEVFHQWQWAGHAALCVVFFALLPCTFFSHTAYGWGSWLLRRDDPRAELATRLLTAETAPGAALWSDFTRLDLLQVDACTTCGRCDSVCPANAAGKPLRPREIMLGVRRSMDRGDDSPLADWIDDAALWSCTTCTACNEACPVGIDVYDKIVEMRRGRVEAGTVPESASQLFDRVASDWNPFGRPSSQRITRIGARELPVAADDEPIELLYWIGCAGSFDADSQSVTVAMVKILNHLGIAFRVLGARERCTGDPARRLGEEGLFQELAESNVRQLQRHRVGRLLTHCPHCFNTFRNEYPRLAPDTNGAARYPREVVHHTQFLAELAGEGRLRVPTESSGSMTFHDPCYLGRGNGIVDAPRTVLRSLGADMVEMPRHGRESFCCGAGGGAMWVEVGGRERIENLRVKEAARTGAETVATGCPFCKGMLTAGRQAVESEQGQPVRFRVKDVAELVVEAEGLESWNARP